MPNKKNSCCLWCQKLTNKKIQGESSNARHAKYCRTDGILPISALLNLGYQRSSAEKAIDAALAEGGDITVESILRRALKKLARV